MRVCVSEVACGRVAKMGRQENGEYNEGSLSAEVHTSN